MTPTMKPTLEDVMAHPEWFGYLAVRLFPDGKIAIVYGLTYGRARLSVGRGVGYSETEY